MIQCPNASVPIVNITDKGFRAAYERTIGKAGHEQANRPLAEIERRDFNL